jgi:hypothetical protein
VQPQFLACERLEDRLGLGSAKHLSSRALCAQPRLQPAGPFLGRDVQFWTAGHVDFLSSLARATKRQTAHVRDLVSES